MAWRAYINTDSPYTVAALEQLNANLIKLVEENRQGLGQLELQLALLNARFEEAFETTIQVNDV